MNCNFLDKNDVLTDKKLDVDNDRCNKCPKTFKRECICLHAYTYNYIPNVRSSISLR